MTTEAVIQADVWLGDERAEAMAWNDGRIVAVGSQADVLAAQPDARVHDLGGRTVLPGFIDAHHHPSLIALYGGLLRLTPPQVVDIPSMQRELARHAERLPPGQWLVVTDWDELSLSERRAPTRSELDEAVPDHPVMAMHYSCHRAVANSRALELAGIDRHTPQPQGGAIELGRDGLPNGLLIERGLSRVEALARGALAAKDPAGWIERLHEHHRAMAAVGITTVVDATVPGDLATIYAEAERQDKLIVPTMMLPVSIDGYFEPPWDVLDAEVPASNASMLMHGPVKLVFDGAPVCAMCLSWLQTAGVFMNACALAIRQRSLDSVRAAMSTSPRIGRKLRTGIEIYQRELADRVVRRAVERGRGVAIHAIGNQAIDTALRAYEAQGSGLHDGGRPRIEHAMFLDRELVRRAAAVGAAVVAQPSFLRLMPAFASAPKIPGLRNTALRWLLDAGVVVAASSDAPVAGFDPLDGIRAAVSRQTQRGQPLDEDQRVSLPEAVSMYTEGAARAAGLSDDRGTLSVGKRADFVVLDGPLTSTSSMSCCVDATVIGGRMAFDREERWSTANPQG